MDIKAEEDELNTKEIRARHYDSLSNLEKTEYNKAFINDNYDYEHLSNPETWKPLGQKYRLPFYIKPLYAKLDDY